MRCSRLLMALLAGLALPAAADEPPATGEILPYERNAGEEGQSVTARFQNFNSDALTVSFTVPDAAVRDAMDEFGYAKSEIDQIRDTCTGCDQAEYDKRTETFYRERGLKVVRTGELKRLVYPDVGEAARRNAPRLRSLIEAFGKLAKAHEYGPDDTLGSVVAFVQTALEYRIPPDKENGRNILGFYPPARSLELGWGDCDSKSAVLAMVLKAFSGVRLVGVQVPRHYLIGVARVPRHGDAYIEWQGQPYVLLEAAGPAWRPPGSISDQTRAALQTMEGVRIEPFD